MDNEEKPSSLVTPNEFNRLLCQGMATRTPKLMVDNQISCVASVGVCRRFMVTDGETPLAPFISRNRNWVHSISSKRGRGQMEFPLIKHSWIGLVCCCARLGIRSIYNVLEEEEEELGERTFSSSRLQRRHQLGSELPSETLKWNFRQVLFKQNGN